MLYINSTTSAQHDSGGLFGGEQFGDGRLAAAVPIVCRGLRAGAGRRQRRRIQGEYKSARQ